MQPHKRGRGRPSDGLYVSRDAPDCQVRKNGRPAGGTHGPSRTTQQMGVAAAAEARRSASEVGAIGDEPNDAIGGDEPSRSEHYLRCSRQQAAWKDQMPFLRSERYANLPTSIERAKRQAAARMGELQAELDESWSGHTCSAGPISEASFSRQNDGAVTYYGQDFVFPLAVPMWTCACCSKSFSPHALTLGCFPSTPITPHVWYDLRFLQLYKQFGPGEGLSATGGWESGEEAVSTCA